MTRLNYASHSANQTQALEALSEMGRTTLGDTLINLIEIRVSQVNGCAFCVDMHVKQAKIANERELRLHHIAVWRESALFDARERAALEWAENVTRLGEHGVDEVLYSQMLQHFTEKELSDLTFAVASINAWNRIAISFRSTPGALDKLFHLDKAGLH